MVVNGACKAKDIQHFKRYMTSEFQVTMNHDESRQLLALQVSFLSDKINQNVGRWCQNCPWPTRSKSKSRQNEFYDQH